MPITAELAILHADACGYAAAMAQSEETAIGRLQSGQRLIHQAAGAHGGRVIDTAGDSALMTFESVRAAFQAAREVQEGVREQAKTKSSTVAFPYRFGLTRGRVTVDRNSVYGHSVNLAARIESLVTRGSIGVEKSIWDDTRALAHGSAFRSRVLFAKPEEPAIHFYEVLDGSRDMEAPGFGEASRNAPVILLIPFADGTDEPQRDTALEAILWECLALFGAQGWQTEVFSGGNSGLERVLPVADYVVRLRVTTLLASTRLSAMLSSRHMRQGLQNFTREANSEGEMAQGALGLAALLGTAIAHAETERIHQNLGVGSFQLVAAGRELLSSFSPEKVERAIIYLNQALAIDPVFNFVISSFWV